MEKEKGDVQHTACEVHSMHMTRALIFACQKGIIKTTQQGVQRGLCIIHLSTTTGGCGGCGVCGYRVNKQRRILLLLG